MDRPSGLPMVLILESRSHLDLGDLTNLLAAELGVMTVRLERAVRSLDGVERVHVNRWGDGAAHLHLWFLARPTGQLQLRGSFLSLWDDIIEPIPESTWRENLAHVAAWLADFGGRAIAEPPRIVWHAPSSFMEAAASALDGTTDEATEEAEAASAPPIPTQPSASARSATSNGTTGEQPGGFGPSDSGGADVPAKDSEVALPDDVAGIEGEGWTLSADDIEESDILTR
jgi:hypothetical protein